MERSGASSRSFRQQIHNRHDWQHRLLIVGRGFVKLFSLSLQLLFGSLPQLLVKLLLLLFEFIFFYFQCIEMYFILFAPGVYLVTKLLLFRNILLLQLIFELMIKNLIDIYLCPAVWTLYTCIAHLIPKYLCIRLKLMFRSSCTWCIQCHSIIDIKLYSLLTNIYSNLSIISCRFT